MEYGQLPFIVEFNGMHRCGKGTQIALLENFLNQHNIFHMTLRGEYYRKGLGGNSDPFSPRWQDNWNRDDIIPLKSELLKREIRVLLLKQFNQHKRGGGKGVLLLDRGGLGRCMYDHTKGIDTSLDEALQIHKYSRHLPSYLPISDLYVVLQPTQYELIGRNQLDIENRDYKHTKIEKDYDKLYEGFAKTKSQIDKSILHIQGNYTPEETHQMIVNVLIDQIEFGML